MMKWFIAAALCFAGTAQAATYYVRPDGNSACLGTTDAPYTGGTACAKQTPQQGVAAMAGGDTLVIKNGSYGLTGELNIPAGTTASPTRIRGEQAGSCRVKPELWANAVISNMVDLAGNSNIQVECLEITDHNSCVSRHPDFPCSGNRGTNGIYAKGGSNIVVRDVNVHGLVNGFRGGSINTSTWERVRLWANADAGWHGATGCTSSDTCDSFTGTHTFRDVEIAWNGCGEAWPSLQIRGCKGDFDRDGNGTKDGYGDGFGTYHTAGTWIFDRVLVHHNTSDGLDLRYTTQNANVTVRRSWFYGNAGNPLKIWGKALVENNFINANCGYFGTRYGQGYDLGDSTPRSLKTDPEPCRASGNALVILPDDGSTGDDAIIRYNTIAGHSEALLQFASGGSTTSYTARIENNVVVGGTSYLTGSTPKYISNSSGVSYTQHNNHVYGASSVSCTASQCVTTNPLLVSQSITAFDPRPQAGSPLIGAGTTSCGTTACVTPATDIRGKARPASPARGAFEP